MLFFKLLLLLVAFISFVGAVPAELDTRQLNETIGSTATTTPITGVPGATYPRLEIRQMLNNHPNQWNLYLLAMQQFQALNQSSPLSYYQIAGIHGLPNVPWDGVQANPASGGAVGYCTHSSVLFPTWHRAYLALFEQEFINVVNQIANSFSEPARTAYLGAASTMRIPYWDWAAAPNNSLPTFPNIVAQRYVLVNAPQGQQTILNPLFRYTFHPLDVNAFAYSPWNGWSQTLRYPNSTSANAISQENLVQAAIENNRINIRNNVYNIFTLCSDYMEFSNDASSSSTPGCSTSLEGIHDSIHALVGGSNDGHMTWLWWAAFDPVFFLHHANVDRLFAMWQAIYPNSYVQNQQASGSTFTIAAGSIQGPDSPLTPFHSDEIGTFWTSNTVRSTQTFHYTYPEFADSDGSASSIIKYVNNLYGPNATAHVGSSKVKREVPTNQPIPTAPLSVLTTNGSRYEYIANVASSRFGLNGPYNIFIFMGNPASENPGSWAFDSALIGTVGVFAQSGMTMNNLVVTGAVPLTQALTAQVAGGFLAGLEELLVVPFLQLKLQWRIATTGNQVIDPNNVPELQISVVMTLASIPQSNAEFPIYQPFTTLVDITHGKAGGLWHGASAVHNH